MLVGLSTSDDAAVYRVSDELAIVQTVDFFTPIVDGPYEFGAIAAANSLSDVYAMGARPVLAMNVVGFPKDNPDVPMSVLSEILRGGSDKAAEANVSVVGGHTVYDNEPKYGMSVTGFVHPDQIWRNLGGQPGDSLILTKPVGTGIISTAVRKGEASEEQEREVAQSMAELNKTAAEIASEFSVNACTDITGFGFLGHLREMVADGAVGARIEFASLPVHKGTHDCVKRGFAPGGAVSNLKALGQAVVFSDKIDETDRLILSDPQTSGGLLLAVPAAQAQGLLGKLVEAGLQAACVGELTEDHRGQILV